MASAETSAPPAPAWAKRLLAWFRKERRRLPWRETRDPYRVWVSEIMLQQTRVDTVIPYYARFLERFPTLAALAAAPREAVLRAWEGLGYYARARNLHQAARHLVEEGNGRLPRTLAELRNLPGLGEYTAAAVAAIAFDMPVPALDGNALRVGCRFLGLDSEISSRATRRRVRELFEPVLQAPGVAPGEFNQAVMELGALACLPKAPRCRDCPIQASCRARASGRQEELPVRNARKRIPHYEIAVAVIHRAGKVLVARRPEERMLGGYWEFPGGKRAPGETLAETARREVREEVALEVRNLRRLCTVRHAYSHFRITLTAFTCDWAGGEPKPLASDAVRWVSPEQLGDLPFPAANRRVIQAYFEAADSRRPGRGPAAGSRPPQEPGEPRP